MKKRIPLMLVFLLSFVSLFYAEGRAWSSPKDALIVGIAADVDLLDPAVTATNISWAVSYYCYERLMEYKVNDGKGLSEVEPGLAKGYSVSPDGLEWTFELRDDSRFDDGSPVNANSVIYTFDRLKKIGKFGWECFNSVSKVEAMGEYTVKFTLSSPFPPFLYCLATNSASIVNPAVEQHSTNGDSGQMWLAGNTAGSGPYVLKEWKKDQYHKLTLNPNWRGAKPALSTILIKIVKDPSARRLQLVKGDIDIANELPDEALDQLSKEKGIVVPSYPSMSVCYLYLNNQKQPLNNVSIRKALSVAVDYKGIIAGVKLNQAIPMAGPIPEGMWGKSPNVQPCNYDVSLASKILQESGVKTPLTLSFLYSDRSPEWEPIGLAIQQSFKEIDVELNLEKLAYSTMREKIDKGDFDIAIGNWSPDFGDPYMFMNYWFDSRNFGLPGNRSRYKNDKVDELLRKAASVSLQDERAKLYEEVQNIVVGEAAYIYLYQRNYRLAMRDDIQGYIFNPMLMDMFNFQGISKR